MFGSPQKIKCMKTQELFFVRLNKQKNSSPKKCFSWSSLYLLIVFVVENLCMNLEANLNVNHKLNMHHTFRAEVTLSLITILKKKLLQKLKALSVKLKRKYNTFTLLFCCKKHSMFALCELALFWFQFSFSERKNSFLSSF